MSDESRKNNTAPERSIYGTVQDALRPIVDQLAASLAGESYDLDDVKTELRCEPGQDGWAAVSFHLSGDMRRWHSDDDSGQWWFNVDVQITER